MDDQVLQKVKECAVDYLGVRMDDIVSVPRFFMTTRPRALMSEYKEEKSLPHNDA